MSRFLFAAVVCLGVAVATPAFAQDAHIGTWKQNFAKSKSDPAPTAPAPQSITRTYEAFGDGLKFTQVVVAADGTRTTSTYSAHFDGKDAPLMGNANADMISLKKIDTSTFESTLKKAGKVVNTGKNVISKDGKTMTYTSQGTNAAGQKTSATTVFDKQ